MRAFAFVCAADICKEGKMRKIEKKKLSKLQISIILAAIIVLAAAVSLVIYFAVPNETAETPKEPPVPLEGEDVLYNTTLIAYPRVEEADIQYISVKNSTGSFGMVRPQTDGSFTFFYEKDGTVREYRPKISELDDNFQYESLYAVETGDGYGMISKLSYLCSALSNPYFEERIFLSSDPDVRLEELDAYGLAEGEYNEVVFTYNAKIKSEDGTETVELRQHSIKIGAPTILETGFYFMVDGREIVYAGTSNYFEYALMGFYSFVNSILVAPGLEEDSVISAYITTNYYQWLGEMHKTEGEAVAEETRVIAFADVIVPALAGGESPTENGYKSDGYSDIEFDLAKYKNKPGFERMLKALIGKEVGGYSENEIVFTLVGSHHGLDFSSLDARNYTYVITEIEAILTDNGEISAVGTPVPAGSEIKVCYELYADGSFVASNLHSVIELSNTALPAEFTEALASASVGKLAFPVRAAVSYTKDNAVKRNVKYVVTEIVSIFDSKGKAVDKITASSVVCYRYRFMIDGVLGEEEYISTLDLGKDTSEMGKVVKEALTGKTVSTGLAVVVAENTEYCEYFRDFITYRLSEIKYFVKNTLISAFRFQNPSERDPFYGDSLYENTMTGKYKIYGLNHSVCQNVVNILAGQSEATTAPGGLVGNETVAVGITPEVMMEYGLYAHTIYFELPRGLWSIDSGNMGSLDDFGWYETLGFTLYISEEQEDGTRFVASDLYDVVTKVPSEKLVFLKYDFVSFWARRDLMLTDIANINSLKVELMLEDMKGIYDMRLNHRTIYIGSDNKGYLKPPSDISYSEFDEITVVVTPEGECTPNALTNYIAEKGYSFVSLTELYDQLVGGGKQTFAGYDALGTSNFKEFIETLYFTTYAGVVPQGEQASVVENAPLVMRMSFTLSSSGYPYVYEFYRYDDRRVMVRLYQESYNETTGEYTRTTPVSDFYVSTFAFKKLVNHYVDVLNTVDIDKENAYQR